MSDTQGWVWIVVAGGFGFICLQAVRIIEQESRRWRRLLQLYLEKQVGAPLPVDTDTDEEQGSSLHLPDDEREELERLDELEAEARAERLI